MTRHSIVIATAMFVGLSCAHAQMGVMGAPTPNAGMGTTSPLGMSTSGTAVAPTGVLLGAAPLATPGVTSGASNGVLSATTCSSPGMGAITSSGMGGSTALFDNSGVGIITGATPPGSAAPIATTCGGAPAVGPGASPQSRTSTSVNSQLGVPTIPMGSTELSNPGLSPAPCPATGTTAQSTSSGAC
jgi:hypothetical protein